MATLRDLVDEVALSLEGYGLAPARSAFLGQTIDVDDLSFTVSDSSNLAEGVAEIGDEMVYIQSVDRAADTVTLSPDGRGYMGSTAEAHLTNTRILMAPAFPRNLIRRKLNETIVGLFPDLWGEADYTFNSNTTQSTYELPSETEDIGEVKYQDFLPSGEWPLIKNWKLDRHADPDTYPSGVTITLRDARLWNGTVVRVVYKMAPQELTDMEQDFGDSGLSDSARACVIYGAQERLVRAMDVTRLTANTSAVDQIADTNPVGNAIKIAAQLHQFYELELADEKRRQEARTPAQVVWTESYL